MNYGSHVVEAEERSIGYQPALDGVRGVAVTLVLLFHLGLSWMSGGYLGVSVFFTLSGFLITTLLVNELDRGGTIRLKRFYGRRARRLLPASIVCLVGACVLIAAKLVPDRSGLRWYVFGGLFQFANWVPLGLHNSYAELFKALSPTDHFWSLAIEEQFYWLWPISILGLFKLVRNRPRGDTQWMRRLVVCLAVLFVVFSISAPITAHLWNTDAAYFATWARIPEIMAGALLAVLIRRRAFPEWTKFFAPVALIVVVVLSVITPAGHGWAYEGALPLFGLLSAGLIAGLQHNSPVTALLSTKPIVFLGRISYGVYLYHWPVFVVLTQGRTNLGLWPLSLLRLAVTFAIALVSFSVIEQPIRQRRVLTKPRLGLAAVGVAIPVVLLLGFTEVSNSSSFEQSFGTLPTVAGTIAPLVTLPTTTSVAPTTTEAAATTAATTTGSTADTAPATSPPTTTLPPTTLPPTTVQITPSRPVRILIVGDSTAQVTGGGLVEWAKDHPELAQVEVAAFGGCGILDEGDRFYRGEWIPTLAPCVTLLNQHVPQRVRDARPDIVIVVTSFWDNVDHRWPGDPTPRSALDPVYDQRALTRFTAYNQMLIDAGAPRVSWVLYPRLDESWGAIHETSDDPARYPAFYAIERAAAAKFPGIVSTIDLATWSDQQGLTDDHSARPDGVHFTPEKAKQVAEQFLGNQIVQAALH